jgi:hypothetical protein
VQVLDALNARRRLLGDDPDADPDPAKSLDYEYDTSGRLAGNRCHVYEDAGGYIDRAAGAGWNDQHRVRQSAARIGGSPQTDHGSFRI